MEEQSEALHARLTWEDLLRVAECSRSIPTQPIPRGRLLWDPGAPSGWERRSSPTALASNAQTLGNRAPNPKYALSGVRGSWHPWITDMASIQTALSATVTESQITLPCPLQRCALTPGSGPSFG